MECGEGLLTPFGLGFTPHIQGQAGLDLRLRPHPVDTLLHLAIAPVAPLHRMRGGGQQLVVKKRQGLFQGRGKELLEGFAHLWEPQEPTPQCGQFGQRGLGPTAPIAQRIPLVPDGPERVSLGQATADTPQGLALGFVEVPLDKELPMGEQRGALCGEPLFGAGRRLRGWRARPAFGQFGLRGCQSLAGASHSPYDQKTRIRLDKRTYDLAIVCSPS
jgi:hypothetical protein